MELLPVMGYSVTRTRAKRPCRVSVGVIVFRGRNGGVSIEIRQRDAGGADLGDGFDWIRVMADPILPDSLVRRRDKVPL